MSEIEEFVNNVVKPGSASPGFLTTSATDILRRTCLDVDPTEITSPATKDLVKHAKIVVQVQYKNQTHTENQLRDISTRYICKKIGTGIKGPAVCSQLHNESKLKLGTQKFVTPPPKKNTKRKFFPLPMQDRTSNTKQRTKKHIIDKRIKQSSSIIVTTKKRRTDWTALHPIKTFAEQEDAINFVNFARTNGTLPQRLYKKSTSPNHHWTCRYPEKNGLLLLLYGDLVKHKSGRKSQTINGMFCQLLTKTVPYV